jgi:hypothetical protein
MSGDMMRVGCRRTGVVKGCGRSMHIHLFGGASLKTQNALEERDKEEDPNAEATVPAAQSSDAR